MTAADLFFLAGSALAALGLAAFLWWRGKAYLLFFQQEEYDARRFARWLSETGARDRATSLIAAAGAIAGFAAVYGQDWAPYASLPLVLAALIEGVRRSLRPLKRPKKPLVMTERARRIFQVYLLLGIALSALAWIAMSPASVAAPAVTVLIAAQAAPYLLLAADRLLAPFERRIKARYRREAEEKLARLSPFIVAITGSYGKTSTKHILAHLLSGAAPTLATPGSVNTEMGITRIVREQLEPRHRYFIVEMGAYGPGSIARLCRLAPPRLGVITAVGWAHYERFKTVDAVFTAKFELAEAALAQGGKAIVNADAIPRERLEQRLAAAREGYLVIGRDEAADLTLRRVRQTADGLELSVHEAEEGETTLSAPLYGEHQAGNILAAVGAARTLGMPMEAISAALARTPQIRHRLEVIRGSGGVTVIDDAYNSNPSGFASALALLDALKGEGGRRILVTPGMVELGERHDAEHARLGELAAAHVDVALVVTPERIPTFVEAFRRNTPAGVELFTFARQADAEAWVRANVRPGDLVLYENNLPDLYETRPQF